MVVGQFACPTTPVLNPLNLKHTNSNQVDLPDRKCFDMNLSSIRFQQG